MLPALGVSRKGVSRKEWIVRNAVQPNAQPTNWLRTLPVVVDKVFRSAVDVSFGGLLQVALWLLLQAVWCVLFVHWHVALFRVEGLKCLAPPCIKSGSL